MDSTIKILGVILLCSAVFQVSQTAPSVTKPDFCGKYDCPNYSVEKSTKEYEVRIYEGGAIWIKSTYYDNIFANYALFNRLFGYINGANVDASKFNMTVPVLMTSKDKQKSMMFYLGRGTYPQSTKKNVKLITLKKQKVYVRSYKSFFFFGESKNAKMLKKVLENEDVKFKSTYYYSVGYSRPGMRRTYKEIWYVAEDADI